MQNCLAKLLAAWMIACSPYALADCMSEHISCTQSCEASADCINTCTENAIQCHKRAKKAASSESYEAGRQAESGKSGALAIDTNQGEHYGFSYNQPAMGTAESRALQECGGSCQVVLRFSTGCAAYAADQSRGATAYGWGTSSSGAAARSKALSECAARNGSNCIVRTWACHS